MAPSKSTWEFVRFLLVGVANTLFGYAAYCVLTTILNGRVSYPYVFATAIATVINITFSYVMYRAFVFRASSGWWSGYLKCYVVNAASIAIGLIALTPMVYATRSLLQLSELYSAYIAGGALQILLAGFNFLAHRHFTFSRSARMDQSSLDSAAHNPTIECQSSGLP